MKKLKNSRGMTLVEMLIAVMLLALLTAGGVTATTAVMANYTRMADAANAEILASTVIESLSNEIRLGRNIKVEESVLSSGINDTLILDSAVFGNGTTLKLDGDGHLEAVTEVPGADPIQVLSGLKLTDLQFTQSGSTVTISFTVVSDYSGNLWDGSVTVSSMYGP